MLNNYLSKSMECPLIALSYVIYFTNNYNSAVFLSIGWNILSFIDIINILYRYGNVFELTSNQIKHNIQ